MNAPLPHPGTAAEPRDADAHSSRDLRATIEGARSERDELVRLLEATRAKLGHTGGGGDGEGEGDLSQRLASFEARLDEALTRLAEAQRRLESRAQAMERLIDETVRERVDAAVRAAVNDAVAGARSRLEAAAGDAATSARRQLVEIERELRAVDARAKATSERVLNRLRSEADEEVRLTQSEAELSLDWLRERAHESIAEVERSVQRKLTQLRLQVDTLTAAAESRLTA